MLRTLLPVAVLMAEDYSDFDTSKDGEELSPLESISPLTALSTSDVVSAGQRATSPTITVPKLPAAVLVTTGDVDSISMPSHTASSHPAIDLSLLKGVVYHVYGNRLRTPACLDQCI